jgi:hypothetical protein
MRVYKNGIIRQLCSEKASEQASEGEKMASGNIYGGRAIGIAVGLTALVMLTNLVVTNSRV